jgi:hypothetical protein
VLAVGTSSRSKLSRFELSAFDQMTHPGHVATWSQQFRAAHVSCESLEIGHVSLQSAKLRMISVDALTGLRIGVARRLGLDRLLELAIEMPEHDKGILNGLQRVPGHHHFRRRIRAELKVQSSDRRRRHRIG